MKSVAVAGATCLLAAQLLAQEPLAKSASGAANDTARFLAGMAPALDSDLVGLCRESSWQQHARLFDAAWADLEKNQLSKVRTWARTYVPDAFAAKGTAFYMFSGPDFLYADTFFPHATTYILCGIEPIGPLPDVSRVAPYALAGELRALKTSLNSSLSLSFFITKKMKDDFRNHTLSGTLPILYIFLARSGKTITDVSYVSLDENGVLAQREDVANKSQSLAPGVRIHFRAGEDGTRRTLYYFCTDISDGGLKRSGFLRFCKSLAPGNSCVKAASYLMHESNFSSVRSFLLENSIKLVQDDSGIPCSYFTPDIWQLKFFGSYPGPIPLFKNYMQRQLAEYYRTTNPVPLDFGIGYRHHMRESTLMVASRKQVADNGERPAAAPMVVPPRAKILREGVSACPQTVPAALRGAVSPM